MRALDLNSKDLDKLKPLLKKGKIGIIPTDTIYGLVGSAFCPETVEEIYTLRKRAPDKPLIILISSLDDLEKFGIVLTKSQTDFLKKIWPNPVSVVICCSNEKFTYLHRGRNSLAFRIPKNEILLNLLKEVGPLVAPSANCEKEKPAETVAEAKKYFGDRVAFYLNGGKLISKPSTVIQLYEDGEYLVLREGSFRVLLE